MPVCEYPDMRDTIEVDNVNTKIGDSWIAGSWMETNTGRIFYPLAPCAKDVYIDDIAHALAYQCRYGGHARFHYSVAQHSVLLADYAASRYDPRRAETKHGPWDEPTAARAGLIMLMHDSAEGYLVDLPRPIKHAMPQYLEAEARLEQILFPLFGLPYPMPAWAKELDNRIIVDERPQLMTRNSNSWSADGLEPLGIKIRRWSPRRANWEFLRRFFMWHDKMTWTEAAYEAWRGI